MITDINIEQAKRLFNAEYLFYWRQLNNGMCQLLVSSINLNLERPFLLSHINKEGFHLVCGVSAKKSLPIELQIELGNGYTELTVCQVIGQDNYGITAVWNCSHAIPSNLKEIANYLLSVSNACLARQLKLQSMSYFDHQVKLIMQTLPFGVIIISIDNENCVVNSIAHKILELSSDSPELPKNVISEKLRLFLEKSDNNTDIKQLIESIETIHAFQVKDYLIKDKNSQRYYEISIFPSQYNAGDVWIWHIRDVSAEVYRSNKMDELVKISQSASDAKTKFLAHMSHEIRTPLNAIIGISYLMGVKKLAEEEQKLVASIQSASKSLLEMINDILDLAKVETGELPLELTEIDLIEFQQSLANIFQNQFNSKKIELIFEAIPKTCPHRVIGDQKRLKQIFINIIQNAFKYTDAGSVSIKAFAKRHFKQHDIIRFEIRDTGIGIAEADIPKLFLPFVKLNEGHSKSGQSSGVGLAIVKHLIEELNGIYGVESQLGRGTLFWLELSFQRPVNRRAVTRSLPNAIHSSQALNLLLVDDSEINLKVSKRIFELHGMQVATKTNGKEAVDELMTNPDTYDAVIMDIQMPVMDGFEAIDRIRSHLGIKNIPVIALTAAVLSSERDRALSIGFNDYLTKPINPQEILKALSKLKQRKEKQVFND